MDLWKWKLNQNQTGTTNVTNGNLSKDYAPFHKKKTSDDVHAMNNWSRLNGIRIRSNDGDCEVDNVSGPYLAYIDPSNRKGCSKRSSILALVLIA